MKSTTTRRVAPLVLASGAFICAGCLTPTQAQNSLDPLTVRTQKRVGSLFQTASQGAHDLHLSAPQQAKLKALAQRNAPLLKAIWSDNSLSQAQKTSRIRALLNEANAVFTPAQKQKLAAAKTTAMMQLFQTASWVSSELNLSGSQQQKIHGIVMKSYQQGRGSAGQFGALRGLILDTNAQINATLSPTQRTKWKVIQSAARSEFLKNARALRAMSRV